MYAYIHVYVRMCISTTDVEFIFISMCTYVFLTKDIELIRLISLLVYVYIYVYVCMYFPRQILKLSV